MNWTNNLLEAFEEARKKNKFVLVDFYSAG